MMRDFSFGTDDVVNRPGNTRARCVIETETLHFVYNARDGIEPITNDTIIYDTREHFLRNRFIHKRIVRRKNGVEEESSNGRLKWMSVKGCAYFSLPVTGITFIFARASIASYSDARIAEFGDEK